MIDHLIEHLNMVKERHGNLIVKVRIPEKTNMPESMSVQGSTLKCGAYGPYIQLEGCYWLLDDYPR